MNQLECVHFPGAWVNVKHIRDGRVIWEEDVHNVVPTVSTQNPWQAALSYGTGVLLVKPSSSR